MDYVGNEAYIGGLVWAIILNQMVTSEIRK